MLYQSVNQRWSHFALGVISVRCFLGSVHADHLLSCPDGLRTQKSHFLLRSDVAPPVPFGVTHEKMASYWSCGATLDKQSIPYIFISVRLVYSCTLYTSILSLAASSKYFMRSSTSIAVFIASNWSR
jgi:hypothetical protein